MATSKRFANVAAYRGGRRKGGGKGEVDNPCRSHDLTTNVPEIRRAAREREAAIDAVVTEIWTVLEARRAAQDQPCDGTCEDPRETCMHVISDNVESAISVRPVIFMAPPPPPAPDGGAAVPTRGFVAVFPAGRVRSRCLCALIV